MTSTTRRPLLVAGRLVELWENPDAPFSWTRDALARYVAAGDWVSVFNAIVLAGAPPQHGTSA